MCDLHMHSAHTYSHTHSRDREWNGSELGYCLMNSVLLSRAVMGPGDG